MRVLNKPYTGSYETSQVYVIDGFIVSDNVAVHSVKTKDEQFKYTDHQPVKMEVGLESTNGAHCLHRLYFYFIDSL